MTDQLDLFADPDVAEAVARYREASAAALAAWQERRAINPQTGQSMPDGMEWCGRCGHVGHVGEMLSNHDLGYCGCPIEYDPTWSKLTDRRPDGRGWRGGAFVGRSGQLTEAELFGRWDRQFIPDCTCGCPWGVHDYGQTCIAYCGCRIYQAVAS